MKKNNLIIKLTQGAPNLEYRTSYLRGFELIEEKFLLLTLSNIESVNFQLKIPLDSLDIKEDRFIQELNIHNDDNRHLVNILKAIYDYNGAILDDQVGEEGIMYNVDIKELCDYINSASMLHLLLYFDRDDDLMYMDLSKIYFGNDSKKNKKSFKDMPPYNLKFSIPVDDVGRLYSNEYDV